MKIAVVMLPRSGNVEVMVNGQMKAVPRVVLLGRGRISLVLLAMLACAATIGVGTYSTLQRSKPADGGDTSQPRKSDGIAERVERRSVVRPLEPSDELKKGDLVVLRPNSFSTPKVQQVAATPNETVVIRRGGVLDSLYMLGGSGYVVVSDTEPTRIVRPEEISGTLVSGSTNN
ncbi:MAG TPA: hypothetical protein VK530_20585 [Candidatus Acidoferrum sp.]|nr:hypothetical protein [Candidatus Acidoferrum sp.]